MAMGKITKRSVDALKAGAVDAYLWDTDRKGFGAKRTPSGKLTYLVQYRVHGGRSAKVRRYTIGTHGSLTPELAGKEAEKILLLVAQGRDPQAEMVQLRADAVSLAFSTYADRYLELYVKPNWPRASAFPESALRLHAKPAFGDTPLPQIDAKRMAQFFDELPSDKPGLRRNVFVVLRRMMRWAKGRGDIVFDPLDGFEAPPPVAGRDRVLNDEELGRLWLASQQFEPPFGSFLRLLVLTGQRRNEVAGMKWDELDRTNRQWLLPADRVKNKVSVLIPLPEPTIAELDVLAEGDTWPRKRLVFTYNGRTPISGFSKFKTALDEAILSLMRSEDPEAEITPWRFHDLRRTMATTMQRMRISSDVIEACENRISGRSKAGSARIYQRHDYEPEKREAFAKWTEFIAALAHPR